MYYRPPPLRDELVEATRRHYAQLSGTGEKPRHVVYRRVWLNDDGVDVPSGVSTSRRPLNSPIGMDAFVLITPIGAQPRPRKFRHGHRREEYDSFDEAVRAASMSTAEFAVDRWSRELSSQRTNRARRQREAREAKFGRAETLPERNARHRQARVDSGLSANAYARLHDGADGLSAHQLRRIVSARAAQKTTRRKTPNT